MVNLYKPMRLGDEARSRFNQFVDIHADPMFDQLSECILTAASTGAHGLDVFGYNANGDEDDGRYAYLANPDEVGVRDLAEVHINLSAVPDWERLAKRLEFEKLTVDWIRREGLGDTINTIYWE